MTQQDGTARRKPSKGETIDPGWAKKHRAFNDKLLDKIVADPKFREALLVDAQAALHSWGFDGELRELDQQDAWLAQGCGSSCLGTCQASCKTFSCLFTVSC